MCLLCGNPGELHATRQAFNDSTGMMNGSDNVGVPFRAEYKLTRDINGFEQEKVQIPMLGKPFVVIIAAVLIVMLLAKYEGGEIRKLKSVA